MAAVLSQPQSVTIFSAYGQGHSSISLYFFQPACHWLHFNVYPYDMRSPQTHTIAIAIICDQRGSMRMAPWGNSSFRLDGWRIGFDWRQTLGRAFIWSVWNKPTWPISAWKVCLIYCRWHVASDIANAFSWNEKRIFFVFWLTKVRSEGCNWQLNLFIMPMYWIHPLLKHEWLHIGGLV